MRCLACKKLFRVKTTWLNLLQFNNYYLCEECINKYKTQFNYVTIPFKKLIHVYSVFNTSYDINPISFILERKYLFEYVMRRHNINNTIFLYYDRFKELIKDEKKIDILTLFNKEIVVVLTYFSKF